MQSCMGKNTHKIHENEISTNSNDFTVTAVLKPGVYQFTVFSVHKIQYIVMLHSIDNGDCIVCFRFHIQSKRKKIESQTKAETFVQADNSSSCTFVDSCWSWTCFSFRVLCALKFTK